MKFAFSGVLLSLIFVTNMAFGACGGGGNKKNKDSKDGGDSSKNPPAAASDGSANAPITNASAALPPAKALDTAQFDAVSSKLGLSEDQLKDVEKAKSDIAGELGRLQSEKQKAEQKYAQCDGDCSSEYSKLNRSTEALKSYNPKQEFDKRLAQILQPAQLQFYQGGDSKDKVSQSKKI